MGTAFNQKHIDCLTSKLLRFTFADVVFNKEDFGHLPRKVLGKEESEVEIEGSTEKSEQTQSLEVRRSERTRQSSARYGIDEYAATTTHHLALNVCQIMEPLDMEEELESDFAEESKQATVSEFRFITRHGTLWNYLVVENQLAASGFLWLYTKRKV